MVNHISCDPEDRPTEFGRLISRYRNKHQCSLKEFAEKINRGAYTRWHKIENGFIEPKREDVIAVAKLLGINANQLLSEVKFSKNSAKVKPRQKKDNIKIKPKEKRVLNRIRSEPIIYHTEQLMRMTPEKFAQEVNKIIWDRLR